MAKSKSFVDVLADDPSQIPDLIVLNGFPGKSALAGYTRLYLNLVLSDYYEIPDTAILHSTPVNQHPESAIETSFLWIRSDAELIRHNKYQLDCRVRYFTGPIQQAQDAIAATPDLTATE